LTGKDDDPSTTTTSNTTTTGPTHPKPKRKQIRSTASAVQQRRVNHVAAKRHKSDAHKAAVRLFYSVKQKPDGMSIRKVHKHITSKYETCPSIATISCYASKEELVNASPIKMGPAGHISAMTYKFLCQAYKSLVPINQMNACAGNNSRAKMIPIFSKTLNVSTVQAMGILNRVIRDTATDIHADRLNCVEDQRIRWTTFQNLDLWFDSWEKFVVKYQIWIRNNQPRRITKMRGS
jgi:hypothetical protein